MRYKCNNIFKWFYPILLIFYIGSISFFPHTHVVNNKIVVHSHPYKKSKDKPHNHSNKEYKLLDQIHHTLLTDDIIPDIDCGNILNTHLISFPQLYVQRHIINSNAPLSLRAPPSSF